MSESKKKKEEKSKAAAAAPVTLTQLLLDRTKDKYRLIFLATRWAQEIKIKEQSPLPHQQLINRSLEEILTGLVDMEDVEKLPPPPKVEKKPLELALKAFGEKNGDSKAEALDKEDKD